MEEYFLIFYHLKSIFTPPRAGSSYEGSVYAAKFLRTIAKLSIREHSLNALLTFFYYYYFYLSITI